MQMYKEARNSSSKRFCKPHRMMLIQGDIKYGPKLPIGKHGAKVQTYLSSAIDDHSRYLLSSRFYDNQEESIIEDTFHQAISRYGTFDACYFDNGSQYIANRSGSHLPDWESMSCMPNHVQGKARARLKNSIRW